MNIGEQQKTKEIFDRFHNKIEQILESSFTISYNTLDDETRIYYNSKQNKSNFKMAIFEENENKNVPGTLIKLEKCTLKINYFEVFPTREGLGTKLFNELLTLLKEVPIKRVVVIPENEGAKLFWKKINFSAFEDFDTQLYLDI